MKKLVLLAIVSMFLYGCASSVEDQPSSVIPVDLKKSELIQVLSEMSTKDALDVQYLLLIAEMNNKDMIDFREQLILALGQEQINNSFIPYSELENLFAMAKTKPDGCYGKENYEYYSPALQKDVIFVVETMRACAKGDNYLAIDTSIGDFQIDVKYGETVMNTSRKKSYFHNDVKIEENSYSSLSVGRLTLTQSLLSFETESGIVFEVDEKGVVTRSDIGLIGVVH
ncbi:hypothetical protein RJ45_26055 [Photobacterium gaetbulicola]|uniref:Lipoprotein n=1 Tax=Photobacterium gaetbulicola TaxID=1295392 RepID=A0A0B9FZ75_9GAMM|nr:hypothetical protein [Photobacterium gaetbulicola]KHT57965.1 hypothetical protein RJ45_26055 [Photobacterium gaetbulicola]